MTCTAPRLFRHRETHQYWVASCMRWACEACIRKVARRWRAILRWAGQHGPTPEYFLTLTLKDPLPLWRSAPTGEQIDRHAEAEALRDRLTRALSRLVEEIRGQFGPAEYLAVVELTTGRRTPGHRPHLHILMRGPGVPKRWLKARWCFHTKGSFVVDVQGLRTPEQAGEYLIGYTLLGRKRAQREHLTDWPGPRIRYSRGFFPRPVAEIRALLWPPAEPGMWEYAGPVPHSWQLTWSADGVVRLVTTGTPEPRNHRKEPADGAAKHGGETERFEVTSVYRPQ